MRKSLKNIFASVLAGTAMSIMPYDAQAQADRNATVDSNKGKPRTEVIKASPDWERLVKSNSVSFEEDTDAKQVATPYARAVMVERDFARKGHFLLLLSGSASDREAAIDLSRHGEAGAAILKNEVSKDSVQVTYMEWPEDVTKWLYSTESPIAQTLLKSSDVVNLSMGWPTAGDQEKAYSNGPVDTFEEIKAADHFWNQAKAIFVSSAGNSGSKTKSEIERSHALHTQRAANYITVGESRQIGDGKPYVVKHSSRVSDIGFVVDNPFYEDFSYRYWKTVEDLVEEFNRFYDQEVPGMEITGRELFTEMLKTLPEEELRQKLRDAHPDFEKASFAGKDALEKDIKWIRSNPEQVLEGFINGLAASARNQIIISNVQDNADDQGLITRIPGTSFAAPRAAGMIADMAAKYPQFSKRVLVAAALLAAEPLDKVAIANGREGDLNYKDNGSGIPYNSANAGYGRLTKDNYAKVMAEIAKISSEDPDMEAKDCYLSSERIDYEAGSPFIKKSPAYTDYKISLTGNITVLSAHLTLDFNSQSNLIPLKVTLISPSGGEVDISPTKPHKKNVEDEGLSLGRSLGHLGVQGQGEWTIRVHHTTFNAELKSAQLTVKGFESGSNPNLIDAYICKYGGNIPLEYEAPAKQMQATPSHMKLGV